MSQRVSDLVQENFSLRNRIWDMESRLVDLIKGEAQIWEQKKRLLNEDNHVWFVLLI